MIRTAVSELSIASILSVGWRRARSMELSLWLFPISFLFAVIYLVDILHTFPGVFPKFIDDHLWRLDWLFDLNEEGNPPAIYSVFLWIISAFVAISIANKDNFVTGEVRNRFYWISISCFCVLLGLDEGVSVHEWVGDIIDAWANDLPVYGWIYYGCILVIIVAMLLLRFLFGLSRWLRNMIILSGILYISGAMGVEIIESMVEKHEIGQFPFDMSWRLAIAVEETLEMVGVNTLLFSLRKYNAILNRAISSDR